MPFDGRYDKLGVSLTVVVAELESTGIPNDNIGFDSIDVK
jgi:hypothetical protein